MSGFLLGPNRNETTKDCSFGYRVDSSEYDKKNIPRTISTVIDDKLSAALLFIMRRILRKDTLNPVLTFLCISIGNEILVRVVNKLKKQELSDFTITVTETDNTLAVDVNRMFSLCSPCVTPSKPKTPLHKIIHNLSTKLLCLKIFRFNFRLYKLRNCLIVCYSCFKESDDKTTYRLLGWQLRKGMSTITTEYNIRNDIVPEFKNYISVKEVSVHDGDLETVSTFKNVPLDNIVIQPNNKTKLLTIMNRFKDNKSFYINNNLQHKLIILIDGDRGVGKSTLTRAIASYLNKDIVLFKLGVNKFRTINQLSQNHVIVMEDCDTFKETHSRDARLKKELGSRYSTSEDEDDYVKSESSSTDNDNTESYTQRIKDFNTTLGDLLQKFDGVGLSQDLVVVLTTSHSHLLDKDLIRPGRIDLTLTLTAFNIDDIKMYFRQHYPDAGELEINEKYKDICIIAGSMKEILVYAGSDPTIFKQELNTILDRHLQEASAVSAA